MRSRIVRAAAVAAVAVAVGGGAALASTPSPTVALGPGTIHACVYLKSNRTMERVFTNPTKGTTCPTGTFMVVWNRTGKQGPAGTDGTNGTDGKTILNGSGAPADTLGVDGDFYLDTSAVALYGPKAGGTWPTQALNLVGPQGPKGDTGATGPQGPSGVVSSVPTQLVTSPPVNVATGGSFTASKTLVGTIDLAPGTYLVSVNFVATPNAVTSGDVFPQMMVYNGPQVSGFGNDLFNVGSGALEDPTATELSNSDVINSYYSGSAQITVPAGGETLDIYAFGYDSDTAAGSYNLDSAVVTATQIVTQ